MSAETKGGLLSKIKAGLSGENSFFQKLSLLLISSLLIPIVISVISIQLERSQKSVDAKRLEESSLRASQIKWWEDLSESILTYETYALDVSWFRGDMQNPDLAKLALTRYNENVPTLITKWRVLLSRAGALASQDARTKINDFLLRILSGQDEPLMRLSISNASAEEW